jgi:gliding motility-associated-like protein
MRSLAYRACRFFPVYAFLILSLIAYGNPGFGQCSAQFSIASDTVCSGTDLSITNQSSGQKVGYQWAYLANNGKTLATDTSKSPAYAFSNTSGALQTYKVQLIVNDTTGCTDTARQPLSVRAEPAAAFGVDSAQFCQSGTVSFSDSSAGNNLSYQWNFNDPSTTTDTASGPNSSYTYTDTGIYNARLIVTNKSGCPDTAFRTITVAEPPKATFSVSDNCDQLSTTFTDETQVFQDTIDQWNWEFGDNATSSQQQPHHQYATTGTYQVSLTVTSAGGCVDSVKDSVTVYSTPTASVTDTSVCEGNNVSLNGSTPAAATSYQWAFGDGSVTSRALNPFYVYSSPGTFEPALVANYPDGRACRVPTDSVVVSETPPINASITTADTQCSKGNEICLRDSTPASSNIGLSNRTVIYGDGTQASDKGNGVRAFCHSYSQFGNSYNVQLTITNQQGCKASRQFDSAIFIRQSWEPSFQTQYQTQCFETPVTFTNTSGLDSANAESFQWDFDNGDTATTNWTNFTKTYTQNGSFSPSISVTSRYGCTKTFTLKDGAENVAFNFNINASADTLCFQGNSLTLSQPSIANADFTWFYGDGISEDQEVTGWSTTHSYREPGQYAYQLQVSNGQCDTISEPDTVEVVGVKPVLGNPINEFQCDITDSVVFVDSSTKPYQSVHYGVPNVQRLWDFGDTTAPACTTNSSKGQNVNRRCRYSRDSVSVYHNFSADQPDCYETRLTFTDTASGCQSSTSVKAALEPPVAGPDTAHDPPLDGAEFRVSNECLGPESRKSVSIDFSEVQPQCKFQEHWVMWDSTCAEQSGNFSAQWEKGSVSKSYGYDEDPCEQDGTRTIGLVIQNGRDSSGNFCYDTAWYTDAIQHNAVDPRFSSDFRPAVDRCPPVNITFSVDDTVNQDKVVSYTWDLGDTTVVNSTPKPVSYTFTENREYEVSLKIRQSDGCEATITSRRDGFKDYPIGFTSGFEASTREICKGDSVTFSDSVKYWDTTNNDDFNGTPDYWGRASRRNAGLETLKWDFGDGQGFRSPQHNPTKTYDTIGSYDVRLAIKDSTGCRDTLTKPGFIKVYGVNTHFTTQSPKLICTPEVQFLDTSTLVDSGTSFSGHPNDTITRWEWSFGDGKPQSFVADPLHNYTRNDTFQVSLATTTNQGCRDSLTKQFEIPGPKPEFSILQGDTLGCKPLTADFDNQSAEATSYVWRFGNASNNVLSTRADTNIDFTYRQPGEYAVFLVGRDSVRNPVTKQKEFCSATFPDTTTQPKKLVKVRDQPKADFLASASCLSSQVNFTEVVSSTPATSVSQYNWQFDSFGTATQPNPSFTFPGAGTYSVRLIATNNAGCQDTVSRSVEIPFKPTAGFTMKRACAGEPVSFTDQSSVKQDSIQQRQWNFGDGISSIAQNPAHTYTSAGNYQVQLIVTSGSGCRDTITQQVSVPGAPAPAFSLGQTCRQQDIQLQNTTTTDSGTLSYQWQFGDGTSANQAVPGKAYTNSGSYTIKLVAKAGYSTFQCKDSTQRTITIDPTPSARFTVSNTCRSKKASFTNQSTVSSSSITRYSWSFGDGGSSSAKDPAHQYGAAGSYQPELVATASNGCRDTAQQSLQVYPQPKAGFSASTACEQDTINFQNTSSISSGSLSYNWDLGDGTGSSQANPDKAYSTANTYSVSLAATSGKGCSDKATSDVVVNPRSQPAFSFADACEEDTVTFTNTTTGPAGTSYQWTFGDGSGSSRKSPENNYSTNGNYLVTLEGTTPAGCVDSAEQRIAIYPRANPGYTITNNCVGQAVSFQNQTTIDSGTVNYQWNFGDGTSSTAPNPAKSFASYQTYNIGLTATTDQGCVSDTSGTLRPYPVPQVSFSVQDTCLNKQHNFRNTSTIAQGSLSYQWAFGDGTQATQANPSKVYPSAQTYKPQLTATSNQGCRDSTTQNVVVFEKPAAWYSFTNQCQPKPIPFQDQSATAAGNSITTYNWDFGDGSSSTMANPSNAYSSYGDYNVALTVTNNRGCKDTLRQQVSSYAKPTADFTAPVVCRPEPTTFTDQSTVARGSLQDWSWNFKAGGGGSAQQNPSYTFPEGGTYSPELIVTTNQNCRDTVSRSVRVNPRPVPGFSVNDTCLNDPVSFQDTSTIKSGTIASREWQLGDGTEVNNNQRFPYTYGRPQAYQPKLIATSDSGCIDSTTRTAKVQFLPEADFTSDTVCFGKPTRFTDSSTVKQSQIAKWQWSFGDGQQVTAQNPQNTYPGGGQYLTQLIVRSAQGCLDTTSQPTVVNYRPEAGFRVAPVCFPDSSAFQDTSRVSESTIQQWAWDFGDGSSASVQNPENGYARYGSYETRLIATSAEGCQDTATDTARVNPKPVADFAFTDTCQPNPIAFRDRSTIDTGSVVAYGWQFGNGRTSTQTSPTYQYNDTFGRYPVTLGVTTNKGCVDSVTRIVEVFPKPTARFSVADVCRVDTALYRDKSSVPEATLEQWDWQFGDSTAGTGDTVNHQYNTADTYDVRLTVTTDDGCRDTAVNPLISYPMPQSAFATNDTTQCRESENFLFSNQTTIQWGSNRYRWQSFRPVDSARADTTATTNYQRTFRDTGDYQVRLQATSDFGCITQDSQLVQVYPDPEADFSVDNGCINDPLQVADLSEVSKGVVDSWRWQMGNNTLKTAQNPQADYDTGGVYNIELIATTNIGCDDTTNQATRIYGIPESAAVKRATVVQDSFNRIEWSPSPSPNPGVYDLYRSTSSAGGRDRLLGSYREDDSVIRDLSARVDSQDYYYTLVFQDSCGLRYPFLNYGRTINLEAETATRYPSLTFNPYQGWNAGVRNYEVQWKTTNSEGFGSVSIIDTTAFIDSQTRERGNPYCYRVIARKAGSGSLVSVSNSRCVNSESAIFVPDAFTPNNDQENDVFRPKGSYVLDYSIKIYNRWGELVFESNDRQRPWNGQYNGEPAPQGVYQYVIRVEGTEGIISKSGSVTLIR